jgi:hypothetical protein
VDARRAPGARIPGVHFSARALAAPLINTLCSLQAFATFLQFNLQLAQPSVCRQVVKMCRVVHAAASAASAAFVSWAARYSLLCCATACAVPSHPRSCPQSLTAVHVQTCVLVCRRDGSHSNWDMVYQRGDTLLRYTSAYFCICLCCCAQLHNCCWRPQTCLGACLLVPFSVTSWAISVPTFQPPRRSANSPASPADFVEIMAPIVSAQFLVQLRTLLEDSYTGEQGQGCRQRCLRGGSALRNSRRARCAKRSLHLLAPMARAAVLMRAPWLRILPAAGWGLDFFLPYVLGYPNNSIAIIDAVCMVHPSGNAPLRPGPPGATGALDRQSLYDLPLSKTP